MRLVGPNGEQVGIVAIGEAIKLAQDTDLDLVEVAPMARPPVCKLMDYGKFKYETAQKARESRKNQVLTVIKEMKLRPKIDPHDYETKKGHVVRFLKAGDKVKITIMFRGREQSRPELGYRLLQRLGEDVSDLGFVESAPKQDGRNMIMVLAPHKNAADLKKAAKDSPGGRPLGSRRPSPSRPPASPHHRRTTPQHHRRARTAAAMPKQKTHSGAKKRFKVTGTGKILHEHAGKRHLLERKSSELTRRLTGTAELAPRTPRRSRSCSASDPRRPAPSRASTRRLQEHASGTREEGRQRPQEAP